jgi:hypothetical protein
MEIKAERMSCTYTQVQRYMPLQIFFRGHKNIDLI